MIRFKLNGQDTIYRGPEDRTLLRYLREEAGLTSVKDGCSGQAACGACLVELSGRPALSCSTPMKRVQGREVVTIEGFPEEVRRTLGRAFVARGAVQCGFCTPGLITRAKILLQDNRNPTREEVVQALKANLCRCTGYVKIVEAVLEAAAALREHREIPWESGAGIGRSYPKYQAYERALGRAPFVADLSFPGMLHGALRFSDHPRARVLALDTSEAERMEGVVRVFTAADIPGRRRQGLIVPDWPMMVEKGETTRYIGDVLAGVAARDEETARKAAQAVRVEYEVLEPLTEMTEAAASSIKVHEKGNLLKETVIRRGDPVEEVLARSAHVVRGVFETPFVEHAFLETEAAVALGIEGGRLRVFSQSQGIFKDREQIASVLGLAEDRVDVVQVSSGGGFGGKEDLTVQHHAALYSHLLKCPVKVRLSRPESIRMHPKRHRMIMDYALGCDARGRLTALKARTLGDTGAYASVGGEVVARTGTHAAGAYHVPHVDVRASAYYTNNPPGGAFRGFGVNQATFAMESLVDQLCAEGGFDPWRFRYDNALDTGLMTTTGQILGPGVGLKKCLEAVEKPFRAAPFAGLACAIKNCGIGNGLPEVSETRLRVEGPERIVLFHGWTEMGQGVHTVARQILTQVLDLDESVEIAVECSTDGGALGGMTTASRATVLLGRSIMEAAQKLKSDLKNKTLAQLAGREYEGRFVVDWTTGPEAKGEIVSHFSYGYAVHLVCLDESGGLKSVHAAHDVGRIINPALFQGQVEGGVVMGLGYGLSEKLELENGVPVSDRMSRLGLLKAPDIPEINVIGVESEDPLGPFGAKGVGEIGNIPTAPALANAYFAFDRERRFTLPLKPLKMKG